MKGTPKEERHGRVSSEVDVVDALFRNPGGQREGFRHRGHTGIEFVLAEPVPHRLEVIARMAHLTVVVIRQDHLIEAVPYAFRAEVHLADSNRLVPQFAQVPRQCALSSQNLRGDAVAAHAVREDLLAGHDAHTRRHANRIIRIAAGELNTPS